MIGKKSSNNNFGLLITENVEHNSKPKTVLISPKKEAQKKFTLLFLNSLFVISCF